MCWAQGLTVMSCGGVQPHGLIVADTKGGCAIQDGMGQRLNIALLRVLRVLPSAATCCAGSSKVTRRKRRQQRGRTQQRALLLLPTALLRQLWREQP